MEELKILCPFCNKPYTAEMETELDSGYACDTCGGNPTAKVEIRCSNCKKIVYVKEFQSPLWGEEENMQFDTTCLYCGGLIARPGKVYGWGGTFCSCPKKENIQVYGTWNNPHLSCDHCYCQTENITGTIHKKCCMCGHRQAVQSPLWGGGIYEQ